MLLDVARWLDVSKLSDEIKTKWLASTQLDLTRFNYFHLANTLRERVIFWLPWSYIDTPDDSFYLNLPQADLGVNRWQRETLFVTPVPSWQKVPISSNKYRFARASCHVPNRNTYPRPQNRRACLWTIPIFYVATIYRMVDLLQNIQ